MVRLASASPGTAGAPSMPARLETVAASGAIAWLSRWMAISSAPAPMPSAHQSFQSPESEGIRSPSAASAASKKSTLVNSRSRGQDQRRFQSRTISATTRRGAVLSSSRPMTRRWSRSYG